MPIGYIIERGKEAGGELQVEKKAKQKNPMITIAIKRNRVSSPPDSEAKQGHCPGHRGRTNSQTLR